MTLPEETEGGAAAGTPYAAAARKFVRGSSLLLGGRVIEIVLNLAVQVLTVRYLSKSDYGAFAYALGVISLGSSTILLGMGRGIARFVPLYHERGDHARAFGTIALAVGTIGAVGVSVILLLYGLQGVVSGRLVHDPRALSLLLILIALAPLYAFDSLLQKLVAVFVSARAIFFRRHVAGPTLKLAAVLLVTATAGDVQMLAYGYLIGGVIGSWIYITILLRQWRRLGLLRYLRPRRLVLPAREFFSFSFPLLSSELPAVVRSSLAVLMLEYFRTTSAIADYRAVLPIAGLNSMVHEAFAFLFVPLAARMFARNEREAIGDLYWQTSIWISILTFPIFAATFALSGPLAVLLFGAQYASSGTLLAVLGIGHFVHAATNFNAVALRVHGNVRIIVACDVLAAIVAIVLNLVLIPRYGALGAAVGTTGMLVLHSLFNHVGLWLGKTGIRLIDADFIRVSARVVAAMSVLLLVQRLLEPPVLVSLALIAGVSLVLIRSTRSIVRLQDTFPELMRIPLLRSLLDGTGT